MQIASILSPEENVSYVVNKFVDQLPMSVEQLAEDGKARKDFDKAMAAFANPRNPDAFGFMEHITSKAFSSYLQQLKPKGTKKKPLSFERLNIMVMAIFKYFESLVEAKKGDKDRMKTCLAAWLNTIQAQSSISVNSQFESMLNIYLVLSVATSMKADAFLVMARFLVKHNQLAQVMIKQVQDLPKLSEDWALTRDERYGLYTECAKLLDEDGDSTFAFRLYYEAALLADTGKGTNIKPEVHLATGAALVRSAIKSPSVLNFEEILGLTIIQELKAKAEKTYSLLQLYQQEDMADFKKSYDKAKKTFDEQGITTEEALLKRQYLSICSLAEGEKLGFDQMAKLIGLPVDDVEEWVIDANINGILEAKIDQLGRTLLIQSTMLTKVDKEQLTAINEKLAQWKDRFTRIHTVLSHQPVNE